MTPADDLPHVDRHQSLSAAVIWPAFQVGIFSGTSGLVVGGVSGVIRSMNPVLFAAASSIQWFVLGSSFWGTRGFILRAWDVPGTSTRDRVYASGVAGGVAGGTTAALTRGRANVVPGTIMFSLLALVGQALYNRADAKHSAFDSDDLDKAPLAESIGRRLAKSKWSPVKVLSDEEYERMLREKLLHVNAEIAIIDEGIERLQESAYSTAADVDGRKSS